MNIRVHIERLILEGLPIEGRAAQQVRAAVEAELARRLQASGLATELRPGGAFAALPAPPARLVEKNSRQIGQEIARSIYASLGRES